MGAKLDDYMERYVVFLKNMLKKNGGKNKCILNFF